MAAVECFRRLLSVRPFTPACLVLKVNGIDVAPDHVREFLASLGDAKGRITVLAETMEENEVFNLIRCCDAFVSLHRSEGYGLAIGEAMFLGLPVIATSYSGNMDFMTPENSMHVGYRLVPVPPGAYPHGEGQHWAEPDLDGATEHMTGLLDNPAAGRTLGRQASQAARTNFSCRAAGLRYARRLF